MIKINKGMDLKRVSLPFFAGFSVVHIKTTDPARKSARFRRTVTAININTSVRGDEIQERVSLPFFAGFGEGRCKRRVTSPARI